MIIYIDMDEVICDFKGAYKLMRKLVPSLEFPQQGVEFWTRLNPIENAIDSVNILREKYDVYILSAPSYMNPASYSGKRIWIEEHFDLEFTKKLILCRNKGLLRGDILIDDYIKGNGQEHFDGRLLHFGGEKYPTWKEVLKELI